MGSFPGQISNLGSQKIPKATTFSRKPWPSEVVVMAEERDGGATNSKGAECAKCFDLARNITTLDKKMPIKMLEMPHPSIHAQRQNSEAVHAVLTTMLQRPQAGAECFRFDRRQSMRNYSELTIR